MIYLSRGAISLLQSLVSDVLKNRYKLFYLFYFINEDPLKLIVFSQMQCEIYPIYKCSFLCVPFIPDKMTFVRYKRNQFMLLSYKVENIK